MLTRALQNISTNEGQSPKKYLKNNEFKDAVPQPGCFQNGGVKNDTIEYVNRYIFFQHEFIIDL